MLGGQGTGGNPSPQPSHHCPEGKGGQAAGSGATDAPPSPGHAPAREQAPRTEPAGPGKYPRAPLRHAFQQCWAPRPCSRGCAVNFIAYRWEHICHVQSCRGVHRLYGPFPVCREGRRHHQVTRCAQHGALPRRTPSGSSCGHVFLLLSFLTFQ